MGSFYKFYLSISRWKRQILSDQRSSELAFFVPDGQL